MGISIKRTLAALAGTALLAGCATGPYYDNYDSGYYYGDRYYDGYYGGYYGDPYYDGYYGGRRYYYDDRYYYDRYYYDRYYYDRDYCSRGPRYDNRCGDCAQRSDNKCGDCKQSESRCERNSTRDRQCGSGDCYDREKAKQQ